MPSRSLCQDHTKSTPIDKLLTDFETIIADIALIKVLPRHDQPTYDTRKMDGIEVVLQIRAEITRRTQGRAELLAACKDAMQTLDNFGLGELAGDLSQIALNAADNLAKVIERSRRG